MRNARLPRSKCREREDKPGPTARYDVAGSDRDEPETPEEPNRPEERPSRELSALAAEVETCDWCGSADLWWRNCKLLCRSCSAIVKSCADL